MNPIAIINILTALNAALKTADLLAATLKTARENAEMTPEQEAEFDAATAARMQLPHWKDR